MHCVIGSLRNATCQIAQQCAASSKTDEATFHTKGAPFYGPGHTAKMLRMLSLLGTSDKSNRWTTTNKYCLIRPTMELNVHPNTEKDDVWSEDDMIEFTANGLWFVPQCQKCFLTNKYLHHGDKICRHTWQAQRLDKTGDYIQLAGIRASTMTNSIK
jgi:hypothetical protein